MSNLIACHVLVEDLMFYNTCVCVCVWWDCFLERHIFNVSSFERSTLSNTTVQPIECAVLCSCFTPSQIKLAV